MEASKDTVSKNTLEKNGIPGIEFDENGKPVGCYTVVEMFDDLDRKFVELFGEEGRRMVNEDREEWNRTGPWHFELF